MSKVKFNDKEYELEELSDTAKANITSLQFVQNEIKVLQARIAVYKTAESGYMNTLREELSNS